MPAESFDFPCGCRIPIDADSPTVHGKPSLIYRVEDMPLDCQATWDLISSGRTKGIFQLESNLGRKWAKRLRPENIEHLAALTALLRPGCLRARDERGVSMTELYCRRKNGEEDVTIDIEAVRSILETTFDVIVYQEQFMRISQVVAGFDLVEVDKLRKSSAKKSQSEMTDVGVLFVDKADKLGVITKEQAERLFANIRKTARYAFNLAHSIAYSYDCYWTAHQKAHFPLAFYTSYLTFAKEKQKPLDEIRALINDAKLFDIRVLPPRFSDLEEHFTNDGIEIRFGLADVKGVGEKKVVKMKAAIAEAEERAGKTRTVWSWFDFLIYFAENVDSVLVKEMIEVGAMRHFGLDRLRMLAEYDAWRRLTDVERRHLSELKSPVGLRIDDSRMDAFMPDHPDATAFVRDDDGMITVEIDPARPCDNLTDALGHLLSRKLGMTRGTRKNPGHPRGAVTGARREKVESLRRMLLDPPAPLVDAAWWVAKREEELLGVPITFTHMDAADKSRVDATCRDVREGVVDECTLGVEVQSAREVITKRGQSAGQQMAFLSVADETGALDDVVVFCDAWKAYRNLLARERTVVAIRGRRDASGGGFIVERVFEI